VIPLLPSEGTFCGRLDIIEREAPVTPFLVRVNADAFLVRFKFASATVLLRLIPGIT
jgi:hypothetical protein